MKKILQHYMDCYRRGLPTPPLWSTRGRVIRHVQAKHFDIYVRENKHYRWMHFDKGNIQSALYLKDPSVLVFPYMDTMMAWQLFRSKLNNVLLLGLGGGSLVRYFHQHHPDVEVCAVELVPEVADLAFNHFELPSPNDRFKLIFDDAKQFIAQSDSLHDLIMLDVYLASRPPNFLYDPTFYQQCYDRLQNDGMLCFNLIVQEQDEYLKIMRIIRNIFHDQTLSVILLNRNIVVFAFKNRIEIETLMYTNQLKHLQYDANLGLMASRYLNN